ncbi:MAG: thiol-disulfide isomerase/thioredoxin [Arcticibacterium sp.]|jgi:thiol-disulfide isomerase/thioredoxin
MTKALLFLPALFILTQCKNKQNPEIDGIWRAEVPTVIGPVPFNLEIATTAEGIQVYAINGRERLELDKAYFENDSLHITMEIFDAEIVAKVGSGKMHGAYTKKLGDLSTRTGEFLATLGETFRFVPKTTKAKHDVSGKWQTTFTEPEGGVYEAVGVFSQLGNSVRGTFLTTTGDYRFLDGNVVNDSLMLSCFDGTHIFLFKALIKEDSLVGGGFSSSLLYQESWKAVKDENAFLIDADSLTFLKEGYNDFNFSFANTKGEMVSLSDELYKNKIVLVQLLGSWCPNCMDESKFYSRWLSENPKANVEIVGLAYEKSLEPSFAFLKIDRMKNRFGIPYEVLLAGLYDKEEAQKTLPMLNQILSFPTTIFLDKSHKVRKIHTGFSGPGTGEYHEKYVDDFNRFMTMLSNE